MSHVFTTTIDRRTLIAGGAVAGTAVALGATDALAAEAEVAELRRLIAEHKVAFVAWRAADKRADEVRCAYRDATPRGRVPMHLRDTPAYYEMNLGREEIEERIRQQYNDMRQQLGPFVFISPEHRRELELTLHAKEQEHLALMERCLAEEEARQEAFGLTEAGRQRDAASEAEHRQLDAIVDYPVTSLEALQIKAAWFTERWLEDEIKRDPCLRRFLASFGAVEAEPCA